MTRGTRIAKLSFASLVFVLLAIQLVPIRRTNPAVESDVSAPAEVQSVLRRACYDCHSNETVWPWYSHVAPVSWLLASDVSEGREKLNFSVWDRRSSEQQAEAIQKCWHEVERGDMPPWLYRPFHPNARLSDQDRAVLRKWFDSVGR